jgi:hypothetical protein
MHSDDDQIVAYKDTALRAVKFLKRGMLTLMVDSCTTCSPLMLTWNALDGRSGEFS